MGPQARAARALGIADDAFVIGWAGRLTAIKRPLDLIRVTAGVEDAVLVLAGDGEDRAATVALAEELGISERVRFLGYRDDLGSLYSAFDVFLLTSANEGAPVVVIEALAAGVPVVATDAGGTASVVDEGETGLLAPVGAVEQLQQSVARLRTDSDADFALRWASVGLARCASASRLSEWCATRTASTHGSSAGEGPPPDQGDRHRRRGAASPPASAGDA